VSAGTLKAGIAQSGANGAFGASSATTVTGILDLAGFSNTIGSLAGSGTVNLSTATLTISGGGNTTFSGQLTNDCGNLTLTGGSTLTLTGTNNNYCGATNITNGTLIIGATGALTSSTATTNIVTVGSSGTLTLSTFTSSPYSLVSSGTVTNQGTFSANNISITGGTLSNTAGGSFGVNSGANPTTSISVSGGTVTNGSTSQQGTFGNSNASLTFNGGTIDNYYVMDTDAFTQGAGTLNLHLYSTSQKNYAFVQASGTVTLNSGSVLSAKDDGLIPTINDSYPLIRIFGSGVINGMYTSETSNFPASPAARFINSVQEIDLYFGQCAGIWDGNGSGSGGYWDVPGNWNSGCVPGIPDSANNDTATFNNVSGSAITVKLTNDGSTAQPINLYVLNFNADSTQYTILEDPVGSSITFDYFQTSQSVNPQINVTAATGKHFINVPLIMNKHTDLYLADGSSLTFESMTLLTSTSSQDFEIHQLNSSTAGTGTLTVSGSTLTPSSLTVESGTLVNNADGIIEPINSFTIDSLDASRNAFLTNKGILQSGAEMIIGGIGPTTVTNTSTAGYMGPSSGNFTITGSLTTVTNSGVGVILGPHGAGNNLIISGGSISNENGAFLGAKGSGGQLEISGGTVSNDASSTIGDLNHAIALSGGTLSTRASVLASNYTQSGGNLELDLTSLTSFGSVTASNTASLGGAITLNALSGFAASGGDVIKIIVAGSRTGTFSSASFLSFPDTVVPSLLYLSDGVDLIFSKTVTPNVVGTVPMIALFTPIETNVRTTREQFFLHTRILEMAPVQQVIASRLTASLDPIAADTQQIQEEAFQLSEKVSQTKTQHPWRMYVGPTGNVGTIKDKGPQVGCGYQSIGMFGGTDYAFHNWGVGLELDYENILGYGHQSIGNATVNQAHGSGYAIWVPESVRELAVMGIFGGGYDWYTIHRAAGTPVTPFTATGKTTGAIIDALAGAEYIYTTHNFQIVPTANLQYVYLTMHSYTEGGAGIYNLSVQEQKLNSLQTYLGSRFCLLSTGTYAIRYEVDLGWQYQYLNPNSTLFFTTINLPAVKSVSTPFFGLGRNTFLASFDLLLTTNGGLQLEANYDFQWNSLQINHAFYLGLGATW
jgi:autotransporter-associated beta strand protein